MLPGSTKDYHLWQAFKQGDKSTFSYIYHTYFNDLYTYALKILHDDNLAKDGVQELFIYLWTNRINLGNVITIKPYLITCLRRRIIRQVQEFKKENIKAGIYLQEEPDIYFSPEEFTIGEQQHDIVKEHLSQVLNQLPERRKEAVYLKYYKNLSYKEIAVIMSVSEKAVINHVYKAFKTIRKSKILEKAVNLFIVSSLFIVSFVF